MRLKSFLRRPNTWRVELILLAVMASLAAGASPLVWSSPLSPLIVGGAVVATALGIAFLQNPAWVLYAAIFLIFLPIGLIPRDLHSIFIVLALLLALLSWLLKTGFQRRRIVWVSTSLLMAGFLIWGVVTLLWAPNPVRGRQQLVQYTIDLLLLLLLVNEIDSLQTLDGLMNTLALNGWVLVMVGIGTVLFQGYQPGISFQVLETNINAFGVSLLITMPGVLWQVMGSSGRQRALRMVLSVIYVLLALVLVALSGSRGGAISLLATLLAFWLWKPTRPWGKLGLLILIVAIISIPFVFSTIVRRFSEAEGGALGGRLVIWQASWQLIREHPLGGVGIGNARQAVMSYLRMFTSIRGREQRSIHNPVLQIWAETGLPGILLYLGVLGSAIWSFVRQYCQRRGTDSRSLTSYFALVACVFAGVMLSWSKGGGMEHDPGYFLLLALLLLPSRLNIEQGEGSMKTKVKMLE